MYDDIGGKIMFQAKLSLWIGITISLIVGSVIMSEDELVKLGVAVMIFGCILSYNHFALCYAMGRLVQNSDVIASPYRKNLKEQQKRSTQSDINNDDNVTGIGKCQICDKENVKLYSIQLRDGYGTRYRNLCADCVKQYDGVIVPPSK